jgi:hypothetical protein
MTCASAFSKLALFVSSSEQPRVVCPYEEVLARCTRALSGSQILCGDQVRGRAYEGPALNSRQAVADRLKSREQVATSYFPLF